MTAWSFLYRKVIAPNMTRIDDANHYIQEDAPDAIAAAVERAAAG